MSKYSNSDNKNFSDSKYFHSNALPANVIKKNLPNHVADISKYAYAAENNNHKIITKKQNKTQKVASNNQREEKYFLSDNTIIQKRLSTVQKSRKSSIQKSNVIQKNWLGDILENLKNFFKLPEIDAPALRAAAEADRNARALRRMGITDTSTGPVDRIALHEGVQNAQAARAQTNSMRQNTPDQVLATKSMLLWEKMGLTPGQQAQIDTWNKTITDQYGVQNGSVFPFQRIDSLKIANPYAYNALMQERAARGRSSDAPLTQKEATSLTARFGNATFAGQDVKATDFGTTRPKASDNNPDITSEETDYITQLPGHIKRKMKPSSSGGVAANEENLALLDITPEEQQFLQDLADFGPQHPATHKSYIVAKTKGRASPATIEMEMDKMYLNPDATDEKFGEFGLELAQKQSAQQQLKNQTRQRMISAEPVSTPLLTDTKASSSEQPPVEELGFIGPREKIIIPLKQDVRMNFVEPGRAQRSSVFDTHLKTKENEELLNSMMTSLPVKLKKPKPPKPPKTPLTTKQKVALGVLGATALGVGANELTKPQTTIPDVVQYSGKNIMYGNPDTRVNPKSKIINTPGMPSNDYWRPLMSGIAGSGGSPQLDKFGNMMFVRSPKPFAPNESPYDEKGNPRGLTTRGKEEIWRFGSDLYDPKRGTSGNIKQPTPREKEEMARFGVVPKPDNSVWWSGRWMFEPDEYK